MKQLLRVFVVMLSLFALTLPVVAAQDATPSPSLGEAIDPAECTVQALPTDDILALWFQDNGSGTPVVGTPAPAADMFPTTITAPLGQPADAATAAAVTATVREVFACFNAGSFPQALALFTERLRQQFGPEPTDTIDDVRAFLESPASPMPPDQQTRLIAVTDVSLLPDGRAAAFVISDDPTSPPDGPVTEYGLFVKEGDRWLVDSVTEFTESE